MENKQRKGHAFVLQLSCLEQNHYTEKKVLPVINDMQYESVRYMGYKMENI